MRQDECHGCPLRTRRFALTVSERNTGRSVTRIVLQGHDVSTPAARHFPLKTRSNGLGLALQEGRWMHEISHFGTDSFHRDQRTQEHVARRQLGSHFGSFGDFVAVGPSSPNIDSLASTFFSAVKRDRPRTNPKAIDAITAPCDGIKIFFFITCRSATPYEARPRDAGAPLGDPSCNGRARSRSCRDLRRPRT